jgi:hypothetical protein
VARNATQNVLAPAEKRLIVHGVPPITAKGDKWGFNVGRFTGGVRGSVGAKKDVAPPELSGSLNDTVQCIRPVDTTSCRSVERCCRAQE